MVIAPCAPASIVIPSETGSGTRNNDGKVRILTTARLHPRKGQLELARALGDLPETLRQRVIYQLAGPGDQRYLARVKHTCHARGLTCEYLGNVSPEQLAAVYAGCDVFAMTPRRLKGSVEGFGIVYLEAGLHGKPVVAWRSGGVADAVVDGKTGLLVDEGDQAGLTAALGRLVADAALGQRLGAEGRRHAMTFDWNKTAAIVRDAINGG